MENLHCLIMAGGAGTRFWPRSRKAKPKQFLTISGDKSLLQSTINRFARFVPEENIFIISNAGQKKILEEQACRLPKKNLIYEPVGRNTLPAISLSALVLANNNPGAVMVVSPSDHLIGNDKLFQQTIMLAVETASGSEGIVTIGITPDTPATGYGYIEIGDELTNGQDIRSFTVSRFVEKPEQETAMQYLSSGRFFWNAGIFVFKVSVFLKAVEHFFPGLYASLLEIARTVGSDTYEKMLAEIYPQLESVSVDYGIMEKAGNVFMVQGDFGWNDLGSWEQIYQYTEKDENRNASIGEVIFQDTKGSYVWASDGLLAVVGMDDVIVVKEGNMVLVCKRNRTENIKQVVDRLRARELDEFL
ncbi:MAG: mannose-1-phosphate guanylyltransferase [Prolixibacteraceae bacterium]|jgi:mannose-1-phosphate guanylyltransferase|nr:mannose-1-phosphate guanylyltransferase [Prolixibacteraceae bacterium]